MQLIYLLFVKDSRVSDPDPDSIRPVDPDLESGSGSRRAEMTHKSRKKFVKVHVLKCWMAGNGLDPDPDCSPASNAGSGSGSNEYGSETLKDSTVFKIKTLLFSNI